MGLTAEPFKRTPNKFAYFGMDLHNPPDLMPENRCPFLFNIQPDLLSGALTTRPPIAQIATTGAGSAVHSLARMNDSAPGAGLPFTRFAGAGSALYSGPGGSLSSVGIGYSGNPLALVPYRPAQAAEPWMYVFDSLKMRRYKVTGVEQQIGIAAPSIAAAVMRAQPLYTVIDNAAGVGNWGPGTATGGTASGATLVARVPSGITAGFVVYDTGSSGMCTIAPAGASFVYPWMNQGSMVTVGGADSVIEQTFIGNYSTTVAAISFDTGSSGMCTIVPTAARPGLLRHMLVLVGGVATQIDSVTAAPDGTYSFRCTLSGGSVGASITATPSFRTWTVGTVSAGASITGNAIQATFTPTGTGNVVMQDLYATNPTLASPIDLSTAAGQRPLQNEDYMHLSMMFDQPQNITEIHIMLGMTTGTAGFSDFYYYVLRPGDFQGSSVGANSATTQQATLNAQLFGLSSEISSTGVSGGIGENVPQPPYPGPESISTNAPQTAQMALGGNSWTEVMFKLGDLTRVGGNTSLTLANIIKLGIYVFVDGGPVTMSWGGWWAGGGYGPDCNYNTYGNQAPEIQWRYRYRNSLTGAISTVSPETRNGEIPRRQGVNLIAANSPDSQVDTIDWERRGGTNPDWHYVLSVPATGGGGGTITALDGVTEAAALAGQPLEVATYQPWPVTDVPHSGSALVVGTSVALQSGGPFNTRWLRGSEIIIAGSTYSLYGPPPSVSRLELAQSALPPSGTYSFTIPEATIEGQPLYGGWLDDSANRMLAVGDPLNPGWLYFSNSDNPDGASDSGYIEVSSPSEPLMNGFYAEGANYVFTSTSLYRVESTPGGINPYVAYRLSGVDGLAGPWAFDAQRNIVFYWGPDGIYAYAFGQAAANISAPDLFPLFPHEGQSGRASIPGVPVSVGGQAIYPPNYGLPNQLRIGYSESFVYATYPNSQGATEALVYSLGLKGWRKDLYTPTAALFALERGTENPLLLVGGTDGNVHTVVASGLADSGGPIQWAVLTRVNDSGDSRAVKQYGDLMLDYSGVFNCQVLWDNLLVNGADANVPPEANRAHVIFDLFTPPDANDQPLIHYNMALLLTGVGGCPVYLYEWQPSFLALPEITTSRVTDWQTGGALHYKFVQGIRIHANTFGAAKTLEVQYDGYQVGPAITVNQNGEQTVPYSFAVPFKCHMMRLVPLDDTPWDLFPDSEWIFEPEPEPANYWITQPTSLGQSGYVHSREMWLAFASPGAGAVVSAIVDGVLTAVATLPAASSPVKQYFVLPPLKGRYWQVTATGTGLQIYENDLEFLVKSWADVGPYQRVKPFGDVSGGAGRTGARI